MDLQTSTKVTRFSLIARVCEQENAAWNDLVELYAPLVAYWCKKRGLREESIEDCVQDVFIAVSKAIGTFPHERGSFRGWLWGIAKHKCLDQIRSVSREPNAVGGGEAAKHIALLATYKEDETESDEFSQLLHRALKQVENEFEEKTWQVFWRTTVDGVAPSEVAEEFGITPATIRKHRSRVLARMRQQLGDDI